MLIAFAQQQYVTLKTWKGITEAQKNYDVEQDEVVTADGFVRDALRLAKKALVGRTLRTTTTRRASRTMQMMHKKPKITILLCEKEKFL